MNEYLCAFCNKKGSGEDYIYDFHSLSTLISRGDIQVKISGAFTESSQPVRDLNIPAYKLSAFICRKCIQKNKRGDTSRRFIWFWVFWLMLIIAVFGIITMTFFGENSSGDNKTGIIISAISTFLVGSWVGIILLKRMNKRAEAKIGIRGIDMIKTGFITIFRHRRVKQLCDACGKPAEYYMRYQNINSDSLEPVFQGFRCSDHTQLGALNNTLKSEPIQNLKGDTLCLGCGDSYEKPLFRCPRCKTKSGKAPSAFYIYNE